MRNLKLVLEYDGSSFFGFQRQPGRPSIQESLEKAVSRLYGEKLKIGAASGRTDTGVHALGQVVHLRVPAGKSPEEIQRALNALLPKAVSVQKVSWADERFHSRYHARSKVYEYRIWNEKVRSPLRGERKWHIPGPLNASRMRAAAKYLVGKHDFKSFCAAVSSKKPTVRTIRKIRILKRLGEIGIFIEADGFLHHMVRNIVGTLAEVGREKLDPSEMVRILRAKDRRAAGPTAPADGLFLTAVKY